MTKPLPQAVLWDMDGTLVDTEPYWIDAERTLVERAGGEWTHADTEITVGAQLTFTAQHLRSKAPVPGTDDEIVQAMLELVIASVQALGVPWRPGALELLASLAANGIPCALVTMSYHSLASVVAAELPGDYLRELVTGDQVANGKPHPEPYLVAAARLGVAPECCVALEDSRTGVASAEAAGVPTIAIPLIAHIPAAPQRSRVRSLTEVDLDVLRQVVNGEAFDTLD